MKRTRTMNRSQALNFAVPNSRGERHVHGFSRDHSPQFISVRRQDGSEATYGTADLDTGPEAELDPKGINRWLPLPPRPEGRA